MWISLCMLSDDWTKSIHLQNDRTVELHTQGGFHYRTRIPRFGRSLAYHFPSCDALFSATGNEVYRLNLDQGRFMTPLVLEDTSGEGEIAGVNCVDINPAHQLFAFGVDGNGTTQFWDPRSRNCVGILRSRANKLSVLNNTASSSLGVTAISSRPDGLSYAIGTSTGHTLLYDIRATKPFAEKDQGYGLPVTSLTWIEGGSKMAGDGMILSADKKVIKIWDRASPSTNFCSITPANDLNHVNHIPGSGLLLTANEGIQMATYFVPQLGPAPRWASFLENITEEMEDGTSRNVYEDYKFVERTELARLGLDHLIGTPALKPYMHGYFVSLKLYDTARVIANPFAYAEHREKVIREKMDKLSETRIRSKKDNAASGIKVNKALAEKIFKEEEKAKRREERQRRKVKVKVKEDGEEEEEDSMAIDDAKPEDNAAQSLLNDPRFSKVFEDPEFEVDVNSREYALLNPSTVTQRNNRHDRGKTAVEDEEDESDKTSSDGLGESGSESKSENSDEDSSDAGELTKFDRRSRPGQKNVRAEEAYARTKQQNRKANVKLVPMRAQAGSTTVGDSKDVSFGQRRANSSGARSSKRQQEESGVEMTWIPSSSFKTSESINSKQKTGKIVRKGVETFGAGMERGGEEKPVTVSESDRKGRTHRRQGVRSGSKNVFRRM
ncbi:hypothetical protein E1B28_011519 [Marasmius oreades]|uniref:NUC153 domain-containing protein n=1 Tax=Marasmius oreades TaxID=181124 RepID=A0A9P7UQB0_9AGAR|nr:uncharacterized protein E1B28_011519 [Marasmius oreades]KAG7089885.1 hypothetical protein E1B28_011519 [Marasmius oreades]